jgi:hypothetical protein
LFRAAGDLKKNHFDSEPKWLYQRRMEEISRRHFAVPADLIDISPSLDAGFIEIYQSI